MLLLDFYQRSYSQNPPPVPLQEAHRPRASPHLYNFQTDFSLLFIYFIHGTINLHWNYHQMLTPINKDRNL